MTKNDKNIMSKGYGIIPKMVMQDNRLTITAKAIYAYFCSYCGNGKEAFPCVSKICFDLNISKNTFNKHVNYLKEFGYIKIRQQSKNGNFGSNVYTLLEIKDNFISDNVNASTKNTSTKIYDTNNKSNNNNNNNNINIKISQSEEDYYNTKTTIRKNILYHEYLSDLASFKQYSQKSEYIALEDKITIIDEIIENIIDVILSKGEYVKISGELKNREIVKHIFLNLKKEHIEYTYKNFSNVTEKIYNKKGYIVTLLYNSYFEQRLDVKNFVKSTVNTKYA